MNVKSINSEDLNPQQLMVSTNDKVFKSLKEGIIEHMKTTKILNRDIKLYSHLLDANPYPFLVSKPLLNELKQMQEALYFAIKNVVPNYYKDSRIQETFNFSNEIKDLLDLCKDLPYDNIGSYRPDFLFEAGTFAPKFCEINARYPFNCYHLVYFGYNLINEYPELLNSFDGHFDYSNLKFEAVDDLKKIDDLFENIFDTKKPTVVLRDEEEHLNARVSFHEKHKNCYIMKPSNLISEGDVISINGKNTKIDQFIFELNQKEILALPKNLTATIVKSCKYINDLRTIFIAHDKRFLTILSRDDILSDYLDPFHHDIIKRHRIQSIPTSLLKEQNIVYKNIVENKNDWLLKPCMLGRGDGIVFGKNVNENEWKKLIDSCFNENKGKFIIQRYLKQELFSYFDDTVCTNPKEELKLKLHKVVGTFICYNDTFFGPGVFRTSPKDLIALSQGGVLMFPLVAEYLKI